MYGLGLRSLAAAIQLIDHCHSIRPSARLTVITRSERYSSYMINESLPIKLVFFAKNYTRLSFRDYDMSSENKMNEEIDFITRVSSMSCLSEHTSPSTAGIQAFCKFSSNITNNDDIYLKT